MKKGISMWTFADRTPEVCFALAKKYGFDGVEVALGKNGPVRYDSTKEEILNLKKQGESYGLEFYSLVRDNCWADSLTSNDPDSRQKAKEFIIKQLEVASWLGCDTILILPGIVKEDVPYDVAYERAISSIRELITYAEKYNVVLGIENVWNKFLLSPLEMRRFIDEINHPLVKAYFDVGNVMINGFPDQWIHILGNRIAKIHFKDYICQKYEFVHLLNGDVDYPSIMKAFNDIGYDDWVTAEVFPMENETTEQVLQINGTAMDKILNIKN